MSLSHDGIPVRWMFKGAELKSSDKCKILSERKAHKLILQNVEGGSAGEYSAVVGHLQCSATLTVEGTGPLLMTIIMITMKQQTILMIHRSFRI